MGDLQAARPGELSALLRPGRQGQASPFRLRSAGPARRLDFSAEQVRGSTCLVRMFNFRTFSTLSYFEFVFVYFRSTYVQFS